MCAHSLIWQGGGVYEIFEVHKAHNDAEGRKCGIPSTQFVAQERKEGMVRRKLDEEE